MLLEGITLPEEACAAIAIALALMLLDVVSGIVCAVVRREFESAKMRDGIGHKVVMLLVIALAIVVEIATHYTDTLGINVPLVIPVCAYIALMEIASVLETVHATYPELGWGIFDIFGIERKEGESES